MKLFTDNLNTSTLNLPGLPRLCIDIKNGSVTNLDSLTRHAFSTTERPDRVSVGNITGLSALTSVSVAYLYALAVSPLLLPRDILFSNIVTENSLRAFMLGLGNKTGHVSPEGTFWIYPKGGLPTDEAGYVYVAYCSKYGVNETGDIMDLSTGSSIVLGNDNASKDVYVLEDDRGINRELHIGEILATSYGNYDESNYLEPAKGIITDPSVPGYYHPDNWIKGLKQVSEPLDTFTFPDVRFKQ